MSGPAMIVAFIAKAAVGAIVGKVVAKATGSDILGLVAGGFAGGGLTFDKAAGFGWANPAKGLMTASQEAGNTFVSGGQGLAGLDGIAATPSTASTAASAFDAAAAPVDILAAQPASSAANYAFSGAAPTASTAASTALAGTQAPNITAAPTAPSGGIMDKLSSGMNWMEEHPKITEIGSNMVMKAMAPKPESAADKAMAEAEATRQFQTGLGVTAPAPPIVMSPTDRLRRYRENGNINEITSPYSQRVSPNWKMLLDSIRNPQKEEGAPA